MIAEDGGPDRFIPLYNASSLVEDGWDVPTGILSDRSLARRTTLEDVAAFNAKESFFTCNDGGQCESGACTGQTCEWNPGKSPSNKKRDDGDDSNDGDPMDVDPKKNCVNSIPAMMYNCKYFPDETASGRTYNGICHNILQFFDDNGLGSGLFTGTYNAQGNSDDGGNRERVCGRLSKHGYKIKDENGKDKLHRGTWANKCRDESKVLSRLTNKKVGASGNENWLSCDEFPWNSLEEGGNPQTNSRSCVPGYQQNNQGHINKLPKNIDQEVSWVDSKGKTQTAFQSWKDDWDEARGNPNSPDLDKDWNHGENNEKSFTFHLFNSDTTTTPTNTQYEVFNHKLAKENGKEDNIANVLGAINIFDNPKYKFSSFNAFCKNGNLVKTHPFWGNANGLYVRMKG